MTKSPTAERAKGDRWPETAAVRPKKGNAATATLKDVQLSGLDASEGYGCSREPLKCIEIAERRCGRGHYQTNGRPPSMILFRHVARYQRRKKVISILTVLEFENPVYAAIPQNWRYVSSSDSLLEAERKLESARALLKRGRGPRTVCVFQNVRRVRECPCGSNPPGSSCSKSYSEPTPKNCAPCDPAERVARAWVAAIPSSAWKSLKRVSC